MKNTKTKQTDKARSGSLKRVVRPIQITVDGNQWCAIRRLQQPASPRQYERILGAVKTGKILSATMHDRPIEIVLA